MDLPFIKMHGAGNDYVYVDCFDPQTAALIAQTDLPALARRMSDRHTGVGADGLVLILPSRAASVKMRMFNADGSEAEMCGNAARCIAKYAYEHVLCGSQMSLETMAGIKPVTIQTRDGKVLSVTVEMGKTLGNPHEVLFVEKSDELLPLFERVCKDASYAALRAKANIECVHVMNMRELRMRVCERGTGETLACGTGACAAAMAAMDRGLTEREVTVHLPGGSLSVRRNERGVVFLTGPAVEVFRGVYPMSPDLLTH